MCRINDAEREVCYASYELRSCLKVISPVENLIMKSAYQTSKLKVEMSLKLFEVQLFFSDGQ